MKPNISIGGVSIGETLPRVIGIVERPLPLSRLLSLKGTGLRLLELRIDRFPQPFRLADMISFTELAHKESFGILGTIRYEEETKIKAEGRRIELFSQIMPHVDAIDIEFECPLSQKERICKLAQKHNCPLLLSSHNFKMTPSTEEMEKVYEESQSLDADILKLAYHAHNEQDVERLMKFALKYKKHLPIVWISMGPWGILSRIMSLFLGSPFTYAYIDSANALGQLSVSELHQELLRFHPKYPKIDINTLHFS